MLLALPVLQLPPCWPGGHTDLVQAQDRFWKGGGRREGVGARLPDPGHSRPALPPSDPAVNEAHYTAKPEVSLFSPGNFYTHVHNYLGPRTAAREHKELTYTLPVVTP